MAEKKTDWCHLPKIESVMRIEYDPVTPGFIVFEVYAVEAIDTLEDGSQQARISPDAKPEIRGVIHFNGNLELLLDCNDKRVNKLLAVPAAVRGIAKKHGFPLED